MTGPWRERDRERDRQRQTETARDYKGEIENRLSESATKLVIVFSNLRQSKYTK